MLKQWIGLPPAATSATLTFRVSVVTRDSGGDSLALRVRDKTTSAILGTLAEIKNTVATNGDGTHNGYRKFNYSLLLY